jgi:hypothetical protein
MDRGVDRGRGLGLDEPYFSDSSSPSNSLLIHLFQFYSLSIPPLQNRLLLTEYSIGEFKKLSDYRISDQGLNLSDYRISDKKKNYRLPTSAKYTKHRHELRHARKG